MAKSILDTIDDLFLKELLQARNNPKAYEKATERFEEEHRVQNPFSYDAFRMQKKRSRKARR